MSRTAVTITVSARVSAWYPSARDAAKPLLTKAGSAAGAQTRSSYQGPGRESRYLPKISHGMASSKTGAPSVTARPTVCGLMSVIYRKWSILPLCRPGPARQPRSHGAHQKPRCDGDVAPEPARTLPARARGHGAGPAQWLGGTGRADDRLGQQSVHADAAAAGQASGWPHRWPRPCTRCTRSAQCRGFWWAVRPDCPGGAWL